MADAITRSCGRCSLCCKLLIVTELEKADNVWCAHCDIGRGCRIYEERPKTCRDFRCRYLVDASLGEEWHPVRAHFVLRTQDNYLIVQADPQRADAWRREPYRSVLHRHAAMSYPRGGRMIAKIADRTIAILPDSEVDLGVIGDDERMVFSAQRTPNGLRWTVRKDRAGN